MSKEYTQALDDMFGLAAFKSLTREQFKRAQKYNDIIEQALQRLEAIDNANPIKALRELELVENWIRDRDLKISNVIEPGLNTIKNYILKAQENENKIDNLEYENKMLIKENVRNVKIAEEYHKILSIIKEKCVDVGYVITLFMYKDYNSKMDELWGDKALSYYLTEEEFNTLKEVLNND